MNAGQLKLVPQEYIQKCYRKGDSVMVQIVAEQKIVDEVKQLHLEFAPAFLFKASICSKCGKDYFNCDDIKFIDDVYDSPKEITCVGTFWTNRKA